MSTEELFPGNPNHEDLAQQEFLLSEIRQAHEAELEESGVLEKARNAREARWRHAANNSTGVAVCRKTSKSPQKMTSSDMETLCLRFEKPGSSPYSKNYAYIEVGHAIGDVVAPRGGFSDEDVQLVQRLLEGIKELVEQRILPDLEIDHYADIISGGGSHWVG
jgi:hypothetical protein